MTMPRWLLTIGFCVIAGCNSNQPVLTPVSGIVKLDGQPLGQAQVRFVPNNEADIRGHGGAGQTDADGKYEIVAKRLNRKGLFPGEYKVIVSRLVAPDGTPLPPDATTADTAAIESVPSPYSSIHTTTLKVTVDSTPKSFDILLKKK